jgi:trigger factor
MKSAARRLSEKYSIPGFRKGKAPYQLVLRQFGEEYVREAAVEELGQKVYEEALDQSDLEPYAPGSLTDISFEPVVFKYTVPLKPEVELGNYRRVRLPYQMPDITDEAVEKAMEHLREHHAVLEPVERPAAMGDVITLDVSGKLTDVPEGEFLMNDEGVSLLLDPESAWPIPGFSEALVGISAGEEREIDRTFPEDYANESLRNRPAHFLAKVSAVKSRYLPEWSDDFAKELGEYETLLDLRVDVRKQLQQNSERTYNSEYSESVRDIVTAGATAVFPPVLVEREIDNLADDLDKRLREQNLNLDDYLKIESRTRESLRDDLRPRAIERLKRALVLGKVIEVEGLDLEEGAIEQRIQQMSAMFGKDGDRIVKMLSTADNRRSIALDLLTDRAVERLVAIAKGEAPEVAEDGSQAAEAQPATEAPEPEQAAPTAEQPAGEMGEAQATETPEAAPESPAGESAPEDKETEQASS